MKECPNCELVSPDSTERCDCGHDFRAGLVESSRRRKWLIRGIVLFNFALLCALASPLLNNPRVSSAVRNSRIDHILEAAIPSWFVLSTVFATIFFFYPLVRKSTHLGSKGVRLDGWFLLIWWLTVVLLVLYGLGLGAGG